MGILDPAKLAVVFVIAFLVLGPERLPGIARRLGSTMRQVSDLRGHAEREIRESVAGIDLSSVAKLRPTQLASQFIDDLVGANGQAVPSTASSVAPDLDFDDALADDRALSPDVGLGRIIALSRDSDRVENAGSSVIDRGGATNATASMN